ncbi:molybdate ABC transporter permease subunit [Thermoanaerobacterium sp. RBIITD]|uniref:molybdate ABC transporter permease subunit n=1 Tax=Thermoanaerobacterium sp. RBIITD TaxID=1550240 RepID=UPI000BB99AF4|nr:molybdate ABC transporter permease subunit [Thermoanaerobacterium sp. RBIITD]SNX53742.1 molybdate transport system permease protein [Thermoanaerobacterium sp. RBIITD]
MLYIYSIASILFFFLLIPFVSLIVKTPLNIIMAGLLSGSAIDALLLSIISSVVTVIIAFIFGTPLAYYIAFKKGKISTFAEYLVDIPAVLPPAVAGIALLMAFGRQGLIGKLLDAFGIQISFTMVAVIMAQIFISSTYYIKAAYSSFLSVDKTIWEESQLIGVDDFRLMLVVYIPITKKFLMAGLISTWARAMGEFGATIIFAGNLAGKTRTMSLAIYTAMQGDLNSALSLSILMVICSFVIIYFCRLMVGRSFDKV